MKTTADLIKRTLDISSGWICQMDIDRSRIQGPVPHEFFDLEDVSAILIKVSSKGMAEGMGSQPVRPSQKSFLSTYPGRQILAADGDHFPVTVFIGWEKKVLWPSTCKPVFRQGVQSVSGKDGIPV